MVQDCLGMVATRLQRPRAMPGRCPGTPEAPHRAPHGTTKRATAEQSTLGGPDRQWSESWVFRKSPKIMILFENLKSSDRPSTPRVASRVAVDARCPRRRSAADVRRGESAPWNSHARCALYPVTTLISYSIVTGREHNFLHELWTVSQQSGCVGKLGGRTIDIRWENIIPRHSEPPKRPYCNTIKTWQNL